MATIERHQEKRFKFRVRICVKISQKDRAILDWFIKKYRAGYIRKNRTIYDWELKDQRVIRDFLHLLLPYLRVKRKQAQIAIQIIATSIERFNDIVGVARLADSLASLNVRSNNRRLNFASMIQGKRSRND